MCYENFMSCMYFIVLYPHIYSTIAFLVGLVRPMRSDSSARDAERKDQSRENEKKHMAHQLIQVHSDCVTAMKGVHGTLSCNQFDVNKGSRTFPPDFSTGE